jgi:hypothetical protein
MGQLDLLRLHFSQAPSISNVEAQAIYRIRALPRRIADLEERGWEFSREWKTDPTGQRYRRYTVSVNPEEE